MKNTLLLLPLLLSPFLPLSAPAQPVHPGLTGDALVIELVRDYTPSFTFGYDSARDTLFATVYAERASEAGAASDSLRGVYSGLAIALPLGEDPTTAAWNASPRFSTEHVWPQSRGATEGTPVHADLHHLAPVQQTVNSSRGNAPFGEIEDADADRWYGPGGGSTTSAPGLAVRDLFSEKDNAGSASLFEPREDREGDVARALFYVWAIYGPAGANQLDAGFWYPMVETLLAWHDEDPVDSGEAARSALIATWQGTENPFVLDPTLARRAFAPESLPVELVAFSAIIDGTGAPLAWRTASETNNAGFGVEHRAPGTDSFTQLAFVASAAPGGTTSAALDYEHRIAGLAVGTHVFRLRQVDLDGAFAYSPQVEASVSTNVEGVLASGPLVLAAPHPNPARTHLRVLLTAHRPVRVLAVVYDALGREVAVAYDAETFGTVSIEVDSSRLAAGVYVLRAVALDGSAALAQRFTVAR